MLITNASPAWTVTVSGPVLQSRLSQFDMDSHLVRLTQYQSGGSEQKYLTLNMRDEVEGEYESTVPATMTGEGRIAVNRQYLAGIVRIFAEMKIEVTTVNAPLKITGDLDGVTVVLMPMFVPW